MDVTRLALKRPVSMLLVLLALFVFGISSIMGFELEQIPDISFPVYIIQTVYNGADPETIDKLVSDPIDDIANQLEGVSIDRTISRESVSMVVFSFDYDVNMDTTYMDIQKALNAISLPDGANDPVILEMDLDQAAMMTIQAETDSNLDLVSYIDDTVKTRLEGLSGVSQVNVTGASEEYIRILINEEAINEYGLTVDGISAAITATDFSVPADSVEQGTQDISLSSASEVNAITDLNDIPIRTPAGGIVSLRDVADISYAVKDETNISRHNGEENISIDVVKKTTSSTVTVSNQVRKAINQLMISEPDVRLEITSDSADTIKDSLKSVAETLVIGVLLSMLTLFIFFGDLRASAIVGSSMPISLFAALIAMRLVGFTLNVITLGALVIAIGMMVDSSIVVLESCFRSREKGLDFEQAAYMGTKEVSASIVASTITTVVVYVPMALISGMSGQMFRPLGFTIVFAMTASLVAALTLIPLFFSRFRPTERRDAPATRFMNVVSSKYAVIVRKVIPHKRKVALVAVGLLVVALALFMGIDKELMTATDEGQFAVTVESRAGTRLKTADKNSLPYEKALIEDPDIETVDTRVSANTATITAYLSDDTHKSTSNKIDEYTKLWSNEKGVRISVDLGGESSQFVQSGASLLLQSTDYDELKSVIYNAGEEMAKIDGVISVTSPLSEGSTQAKVEIDSRLAMNAGVTPSVAALALRNVITGVKAMTISHAGDEYDVYLEYPKGRYDDLNSLTSISVMSTSGVAVPLGEIATIKYEESQQEIQRNDGLYTLELTGVTADDDRSKVQKKVNEMAENLDMGKTVTIGQNNIMKMMNDEFSALGGAIATAVFLVFLVMAMQFESVRFSVMVMLSIPFALIGCFGLMFIARQTISMTSLMGFLMLVGIVVNNGILFVDTANRLKSDYPIEEALARSGEIRLRPILMTTLTTILSMLPMALGLGTGTESMQGMSYIIIGGLTASTILILFLLPSFYLIFMKKERKPRAEGNVHISRLKNLFHRKRKDLPEE